jgi:hypothetical protein
VTCMLVDCTHRCKLYLWTSGFRSGIQVRRSSATLMPESGLALPMVGANVFRTSSTVCVCPVAKASSFGRTLGAEKANIKHEFEFFHDPDGVPWARVLVGGQNGHYEHMEVRGKGSAFELFITKRLRDDMGGMPKPSWVAGTINECKGVAAPPVSPD